MEYVIETNDLCKAYGGRQVLHNVTMHVEKGAIYGFIGKNGAGKTTTMRQLIGLEDPTKGSIKLFGSTDLNAGRRKIGSLIEAPGLYKDCTAFENLKRFAILSGGTDEEIKNILNLVGLGNTGNKKAGQFSLGMRQRLGIGIALLGHPELLVLDEPINGLDPAGIKEVRDTLLDINKKGTTILISSHLLDELSKVVTHYGIISGGELVDEISAAELEKKYISELCVTVTDAAKGESILKSAGLINNYEVTENTIHIKDDDADAAKTIRALVTGGVDVTEAQHKHDSLENYFLRRLG